MTLADTNVLLDVLLEGSAHGDDSQRRLELARRRGRVQVNLVVAAELAPAFPEETLLWDALRDAGVDLIPYPQAAIYVAGSAFRDYRRRGGRRERILADFLIGAHAVAAGLRLLTRDRGFYRSSFPKIRLA